MALFRTLAVALVATSTASATCGYIAGAQFVYSATNVCLRPAADRFLLQLMRMLCPPGPEAPKSREGGRGARCQ